MADNSVTFDPSLGEAVPTSQITAPQSDSNLDVDLSHQELADIHAERARANTAANLSDRRLGTAGDPTAMDQFLFAKQKELQVAQDAGDFMAVERLQNEVLSLANKTLAAGYADPQSERDIPEVGDLADTRAGLKQDATIESAMQWASETLDQDTLSLVQKGLESEDVTVLEETTDILKDVHKSKEYFSRVENPTEMAGFDDSQISWITENHGAEAARNLQTINYGIRQGKLTFQEAFRALVKTGSLKALTSTSRAGIGVNIGLF